MGGRNAQYTDLTALATPEDLEQKGGSQDFSTLRLSRDNATHVFLK
jgi:hypothetical protein